MLLFRPAIIGNIFQLTNTETMMSTDQNKRLVTIIIIFLSLLLIPLVAMNFTSEVNWKLFDFLIASVLLVGTGVLLELILRKIKTKEGKIFFSLVLFTLLLLLWAELAVGIFGTPFAGS